MLRYVIHEESEMHPNGKIDNASSMRNEKQLRGRLRSAANAARFVLENVFASRRPADRALAGWLRENRQCGAGDRRFIGETIYALLRYWGVLRKFLPPERRSGIESGHIRLAAGELDALFLAAYILNRSNAAAAGVIAAGLGLKFPETANSDALPVRAAALAETFGLNGEFSAADLVPEWVLRRFPPEFPLERFLSDLQRRPPMWLRMQCHEPDRLIAELRAQDLPVRRHEKIRSALSLVNPRVNLYTLDAFRRGEFEIQDLASQCIGLAAAPRPGERWLDCCAGAGGKTLQLADLMRRTGTVTACDVRAYKLDDLRLRARRAGFPNITTREWNGRSFKLKPDHRYDGVLADAPCSCSGVWRRNPEGRWTLRPEEIAEHAARQAEILDRAAAAVRPGGVLIYATCSVFAEENGDVVRQFLAGHPEFSPESFPHPLTGEPTEGTMQIFSFEADCDSMFAARMRKNKEAVQ